MKKLYGIGLTLVVAAFAVAGTPLAASAQYSPGPVYTPDYDMQRQEAVEDPRPVYKSGPKLKSKARRKGKSRRARYSRRAGRRAQRRAVRR